MTRTLSTLFLMMCAVGLTGCEKSSIILPAFAAPKPQRDYIQELRVEAKRRHMWWRIYCTDWMESRDQQFQAELCIVDCSIIYAEDGAKGFYAGTGATQQDAARDLLYGELGKDLLINHKTKDEEHKQCSPMLHGGPQ